MVSKEIISRDSIVAGTPDWQEGFDQGVLQSNKWISIEDEAPEQERNLLYFFECTGVCAGRYYGIEADYCPETGHVFASHDGWLTGDVTHWQYFPDAPEGFEHRHVDPIDTSSEHV